MNQDDGCAHDGSTAPQRLRTMPFWLLGRASLLAERATTSHLVEAGLHRYWYGILAGVEEFGPSSQADLGRRLGVDPSDMVGALNALTEAGLVERRRDPDDRRRNLVVLTRAGRRKLERFDRAILEAQSDYLDALDEGDRAVLVDLLQRLVAARASRPAAEPR